MISNINILRKFVTFLQLEMSNQRCCIVATILLSCVCAIYSLIFGCLVISSILKFVEEEDVDLFFVISLTFSIVAIALPLALMAAFVIVVVWTKIMEWVNNA